MSTTAVERPASTPSMPALLDRAGSGSLRAQLRAIVRYWAIASIIATMMALFTGFQTLVQFVLRGEEMSYLSSLRWSAVIWYLWALLAPFAIVLTLRYPIERGPALVKAIALHVVAAAAFIVLHATLAALVMGTQPAVFGISAKLASGIVQLLAMQAHWGLLSYVALIALVHVAIYFRRARDEALAREELRTQSVAAQLTALAQQMQPHFLFNSLNALVAMQDEGSAAQTFTIRLADMLRLLLQGGGRTTATLAEELQLVEAYLEIERARLGSRLRTDISIPAALAQCRLPAFLLQPLVENAVTHGIARSQAGGDIQIRASQDASGITITISNTGDAASAEPQAGQGMQLAIPNCRRRLLLMYGAGARFDAAFVTRNLFRASIILPGHATGIPQPA